MPDPSQHRCGGAVAGGGAAAELGTHDPVVVLESWRPPAVRPRRSTCTSWPIPPVSTTPPTAPWSRTGRCGSCSALHPANPNAPRLLAGSRGVCVQPGAPVLEVAGPPRPPPAASFQAAAPAPGVSVPPFLVLSASTTLAEMPGCATSARLILEVPAAYAQLAVMPQGRHAQPDQRACRPHRHLRQREARGTPLPPPVFCHVRGRGVCNGSSSPFPVDHQPLPARERSSTHDVKYLTRVRS
jgi:hypothetical protein